MNKTLRNILKKFVPLTIGLRWSILFSQPVAITTVLGPSDMELKLIQEQERSETLQLVDEQKQPVSIGSSRKNSNPPSESLSPTIQTIAPHQVGLSALQFDNLPKIVSEIVNNFEGSFEIKNQQKKYNEELCGQKLNEMKQLVESQLKRSIYKVECSEPEFRRIDGQKMQFTSKAMITFF